MRVSDYSHKIARDISEKVSNDDGYWTDEIEDAIEREHIALQQAHQQLAERDEQIAKLRTSGAGALSICDELREKLTAAEARVAELERELSYSEMAAESEANRLDEVQSERDAARAALRELAWALSKSDPKFASGWSHETTARYKAARSMVVAEAALPGVPAAKAAENVNAEETK